MKLEHVALYVDDLEAMRQFYEKYFGAKANTMYHNPKTSLKTYFLSFDNGCRLEIMARDQVNNAEKGLYNAGYIHIAFSLGSKEAVDTLTKRLENDGYKVLSQPRTTGDGYYESCIIDPEGNQVELVA